MHRIETDRPGLIIIDVDAPKELSRECGGHRIQRIPPTERRGRVHTSTVTVAVLEDTEVNTNVNENDIRVEWFSGSGAGGQHRNKTQNSCRLHHIPTGIVATCSTRSRESSLRGAREEINRRVYERESYLHNSKTGSTRKQQVGSGMRGDKIRTYRFQEDQVTDHKSGKTAKASKVLKGYFELLW